MHGSSTAYSGFVVNKKVSIYGNGYSPGQNNFEVHNKLGTAINGNITIDSLAVGVTLESVYVAECNLKIRANDFAMKYCYFNSANNVVFEKNADGTLFLSSIIRPNNINTNEVGTDIVISSFTK